MKTTTLYSVQALRAIAASLVVILHTYVYLEARHLVPGVPSLVDSGRTGVDIFFVISGFIMVYISGNKFGQSGAPKDFLIKRIIRIVPIYWFYTSAMVVLLLLVPHLFSDGKSFVLAQTAASYLFIPWENNLGIIKPVLQVGWTLNYEMYFYLIFTLLLFFRKTFFLRSLSAILFIGFLAGLLLPAIPGIFSIATSSLLIEFLMGCVIGTLYLRNTTLPTYLSVIMLLTGLAILISTGIFDFSGIPRPLKWGVPSALLVAGAIFLEANRKVHIPSLFVKLGNSSYSLYLIHIFTINAVGKVWTMTFGNRYEIFIFVAVLLSILAGHIAYILFEKPMTSYLNKAYKKHVSARNSTAITRQA